MHEVKSSSCSAHWLTWQQKLKILTLGAGKSFNSLGLKGEANRKMFLEVKTPPLSKKILYY